jgi:DNA repair protein RadC
MLKPNFVSGVDKNDLYQGHRQRLRKKFLISPKAVFDYEILEMLLFSIFPRKDTKVLAKNLLSKFGTLKNAIFASEKEVKKVKGLGDSTVVFFALLKETFVRLSLQPLNERPIVSSDAHVIEYYRNVLSLEKKEQMRAMFINNSNKLIAEEQLQHGTVDQVNIYLREVVQKALDHGSSAVIVVHNHPSGNPTPSREDMIITENLKHSLEAVGIKLLDHIIIAENSTYSFAASHNLL